MEFIKQIDLKSNQESIYQKLMGQTYTNASQIFFLILPIQFVVLVLLAFFVTPYTWAGNESSINQTIFTTIGLGLLAMGLPVYLVKNNPESSLTRYSVAIGQMISSAILIDIFGGRIEAHFHIFISLAFLSIYKDFKVILIATVVVVIDHLTRGLLFPFSLFGINTVDFIRIVEHAIYVVALDLGLFVMITNSTNETKTIAIDKSNLEEQQIIAQNALKDSKELIEIQNNELTILTSAMEELASGKIDVRYNTNNGDKFPIYSHLARTFNAFVEVQSNVVNYANSLAKGDLSTNIEARSKDDNLVIAMNTVSQSLLDMVKQIENVSLDLSIGKLYSKMDNANLKGSYQDLANNFNSALEVVVNFFNVNSNLMIANAERNITFINNPLLEVIRKYEGDFRKSFPSFDSNKLIGISIDGFHKKPEYNKGILTSLSNTHAAIINVGDRKFSLSINPIKDRNGKTLCFIVNWVDITGQVTFNNSLENLTKELNDGVLSYRLNPNEQSNEFIELSNSINNMIENVIDPLLTTSNYLDRISKGDIPNVITNDYSGDYELIKNNINKLINTMNNLIYELDNMSREHNLGDIDVYANEEMFEGTFNKLIHATNNLVKSHIDVKKKAMYVFGEFGNGNFEADLEKLPGKKVFINNTINAVRDNLVNVNQEMAQLIDAAQRGELSFRADANRFKGDWSNMIKSINQLIDNIVDPINDAGIALSELAQGDLTTRINGNYGGDFEKLKNNINFLGESLQQVISKVVESVQTTASTSHQLTAAAESMAAAAQEQSAQTDDVASAVEEMSRTITENASSATRTAALAEENGQVALKGGKVVGDTVNKMKDIAKVVKNTSNSIEKLGSSSKAIGEIISVIDDIADQTNLLALNAAIEAARAGEQGRGFAVVADEVRKLAERTSEATKQIAKMIKGIQQETQEAVSVMQTGTQEVENGIKLADEAGQSLQMIVSSSQELINMIVQISAASEEQSATSEEISKNVMSISRVISDSAKQIEEIADSSENLSRQTSLLIELTQQFQIDNGRTNNRKLTNTPNNRNLLSK